MKEKAEDHEQEQEQEHEQEQEQEQEQGGQYGRAKPTCGMPTPSWA